MYRPYYMSLGAASLLSLSLVGCGSSSDSDSTEEVSAFASSCEALVGLEVEGGSVTEATYTEASEGDASSSLWPNHCLVRGSMNDRTGIDGKSYALQFEVRMPEDWNNRLYYQGGSGVDGSLFTAVGKYAGGGNTSNALTDGFSVVTTDSGHIAETGVANGSYLFGADPQARDEYGDMQIPQVTAAARTVLDSFYGAEDDYAYFVGCSNGGRQAMIAAQEYPELFDGIIASAPGFKLAQSSVQALYQAQLTAAVAPTGDDGLPDLTQGLTDDEMTTFENRVLSSCDAADGVEDGMVSSFSSCNPDPMDWVCAEDETENCLSEEKAEYVSNMFAGAHTTDGELIYAAWPYDPGMSSQFGNPFLTIFSGEASHIYTTPPTITEDLKGYALDADIDTEFEKMYATNGTFQRSGVEFTNGESPDLDAFLARGGKLMILNGSADLAFSIKDVEAYYEELEARYGDSTSDFVKAYFIPGMAHCSGGDSTDEFDSFGTLQAWVENDSEPAEMIATAGDDTSWPGRTRPLCPFPQEAIYNGTGDIESADSFTCQ